MERIKGLIDAPFTPFYENGEVNSNPLKLMPSYLLRTD